MPGFFRKGSEELASNKPQVAPVHLLRNPYVSSEVAVIMRSTLANEQHTLYYNSPRNLKLSPSIRGIFMTGSIRGGGGGWVNTAHIKDQKLPMPMRQSLTKCHFGDPASQVEVVSSMQIGEYVK